MIVDSSAIVAVVLRQDGFEPLVSQLARHPHSGIGAPTLVETGIVLTAKLGVLGRTLLARVREDAGLVVIPFDDDHWRVAVDAFDRFGKGRHPAALNFGDCLTYATARLANEPLLAVGDDFRQTDLALAVP